MVRRILIFLSLLSLPATVDAGTNNTIEIKEIMGNPMDMIRPTLDEIHWLFGTVYGWTFLVVLLCIVVAIAKSAYGSITGNAATKQEGKSAVIDIVAIVFIGVLATATVVYLFNTFIFK